MWVLMSAAVGSGLIDLLAIARGWTKARYVWKPLTMVLIIAMALIGADLEQPLHLWLLAGLVLSLAGDVFLVLPSDRFLAGLSAFFAAHVCYIVAFDSEAFSENGLGLAVGLAVFGLAYGAVLRRGVLQSGGVGMLVAVACYITIILVMVWRAVLGGDAWVMSGALLFMVSDSVLAWDRFVRPSLVAQVGVMVTYYAAQFLLALSLFSDK